MDEMFAEFNSAMDLDAYQENNAPWFSYTGDVDVGWNRTLDYIFTNGSWANEGTENYVMQSLEQGGYETLPLSDHAPIHVLWEVGQ